MKKHKKLILGLALATIMVSATASWGIVNATSKAQPNNINQQYLQAFFTRYVSSLNTPTCSAASAFYSPDAISVGAWGIEMNNKTREAYFCTCKQAFPSAQLSIKSIKFEPTSETSGRITWEFGIKAGKQVQPFLGVMSKNANVTPDDSMAFDHEGVSIAEVEIVDQTALTGINSLKQQIASIDRQMASGSLGQQTGAMHERRALLDQQLGEMMVANIKITRQTSFQNMDAFLKKLKDE